MEWVSCKDYLPAKGQMCDCYIPSRGRKTNYEYEGEGVFYDSDYDKTLHVECEIINESVTHWMPIPSDPKL